MSVGLSTITDSYYSTENDDELEPPSLTLFGRESESMVLHQAYEQVVKMKKCAKTILIHGESGTGKTTLVDSLRETVCETQGFFCAGKYFQNSGIQQEPYYAIMAAFSDLCDLVLQSEDFGTERKNEIQRGLGSDGQLLARAISNLAPFLGEPLAAGELVGAKNQVALAIFMVACKNFLHTMSSEKHPVTIFLDDIQWADEGSRDLIRMLSKDGKLENVMIILAYRDEDASLVAKLVSDITNAETVDIQIRNLEPDGVHQLICQAVKSTASNVEDLSDLVYLKTRGNPLHVNQLLEVIQREGLFTFDRPSASFVFDVDMIQEKLMVSDSLADVLALKIKRLPLNIVQTLKIASLIGFRFKEDILMRVAPQQACIVQSGSTSVSSYDTVSSLLSEACSGGFIEKTRDGFQFSHDKLQASFQSMISTDEEEQFHLLVGEAYLSIESAESVYRAAEHLNRAPGFICNESSKRIKLAQLNLEAAMFCKAKSAFVSSAILLRRGLVLLETSSQGAWTEHFDLAFELSESLAKMELIVGNFKACKKKINETLRRAKTKQMRMTLLLIDVEVRMAGNEMDGSIAAANRALSALGIKMPRKVGYSHVLSKLLRVRRMIRGKSDDDILQMLPMQDESSSTAVKLLLHVALYCFFKQEELQASYSAFLAMQLTLKHGLSPHSAIALTMLGFVELFFGNHQRAYRLGKLSVKLLNQIKCVEVVGPTIGLALSMLTHWKDPVRDFPDSFCNAANSAFSVGDMVYGVYCVSSICAINLLLGVNLQVFETEIRAAYQKVLDLGQESLGMWVQPGLQCVLQLQSSVSNWRDLTILNGEVMNETNYILQALEANHPILCLVAWQYKAQLACWFGYWAISESTYSDMAAMGPSFHLSFGLMPNSLFNGISSIGMYRNTNRRKHLKVAQKCKKRLEKAISLGSPNAEPFLALLCAERLSVQKNASIDSVAAAYNQAIDATARANLCHLEALANERAGFYHAKVAREGPSAESYFDRAMHLYKYEWGSVAKFDWLAEQRVQAMARLQSREAQQPPGRVVTEVLSGQHPSLSTADELDVVLQDHLPI